MSHIKLEIPANDPVALKAMSGALSEMAVAHGADGLPVPVPTPVEPPVADTPTPVETVPTPVEPPVADTPTPVEPVIWTPASESGSMVEEPEKRVRGAIFPEYPVDNGHGVMVDKNGHPWDKRIHADSKAVKSDGTWRIRRCPKDQDKATWENYVEAVKVELTNTMSAPTPVTAPEVDDDDVAATAAGFGNSTPVPTQEPVTVIPPVVEAPAPVEPPVTDAPVPTGSVTTFQELMKYITTNRDKVDVQKVTEICQNHGIQGIPLLNSRPDLIPTVYSELEVIVNG